MPTRRSAALALVVAVCVSVPALPAAASGPAIFVPGPPEDGGMMLWTPDRVRTVLTSSGFGSSPSPVWDDTLSTALVSFQRAAGLTPSGALNTVTLQALTEAERMAPLSAVIDLSEQHVYLYGAGGAFLARWPVSTGRPGHTTPTGVFKVTTRTRLGADRSRTVRMDWFTRFNGGIGFHGIPWKGNRKHRLRTQLGVRPASHGCIRMHDEQARVIYERMPPGARVVVRP